MQVSVELNNSPTSATVTFAQQADLDFLGHWTKSLAGDQNPWRSDALELAQIAVHRFEAHAGIQPYARSFEEIGDHIEYDPQCEVACLVILKCDWFSDSTVIGVSHFRRTWRNRIILDYLTVHPFIVRPPGNYSHVVRGVGSALLYFLSTVAKYYDCDAIWGEATATSCGFYKHVLHLDSVEDLIYAPRSNFLRFIEDMGRTQEGTNASAEAQKEIYDVEMQHPPFVGSKTAVFNPARRLAHRFLALPYHVQCAIAGSLGLISQEDRKEQPTEQFNRMFRRAADEKKLSALWRQVEEQYPDGGVEDNPFQES